MAWYSNIITTLNEKYHQLHMWNIYVNYWSCSILFYWSIQETMELFFYRYLFPVSTCSINLLKISEDVVTVYFYTSNSNNQRVFIENSPIFCSRFSSFMLEISKKHPYFELFTWNYDLIWMGLYHLEGIYNFSAIFYDKNISAMK